MLLRRKKKIGYGIGFIAATAALVALIAFASGGIEPRPEPTPSPSPEPEAIVIEEGGLIRQQTGNAAQPITFDFVARLRNPNLRAGVAELPVTFVLTNQSGAVVHEATVDTYLLPGAIQYVVALDVVAPPSGNSLEVRLPSRPAFSLLPASVALPRFSSFVHTRTQTNSGSRIIEEQKGLVRNVGTTAWQSVEVIGIALDRKGAISGAGKTFLGALAIGEQREFTLQWPASAEVTERVIVLPTTNIFKEENVIRALGDPGLLR